MILLNIFGRHFIRNILFRSTSCNRTLIETYAFQIKTTSIPYFAKNIKPVTCLCYKIVNWYNVICYKISFFLYEKVYFVFSGSSFFFYSEQNNHSVCFCHILLHVYLTLRLQFKKYILICNYEIQNIIHINVIHVTYNVIHTSQIVNVKTQHVIEYIQKVFSLSTWNSA